MKEINYVNFSLNIDTISEVKEAKFQSDVNYVNE